MVIRTPDQRLRVFVSSTVGEADELAEERRAVSRAISALRLTPVLIELGPGHPTREVDRAYLAHPRPSEPWRSRKGRHRESVPARCRNRMSGTVRLGNPGAGEGEEVP